MYFFTALVNAFPRLPFLFRYVPFAIFSTIPYQKAQRSSRLVLYKHMKGKVFLKLKVICKKVPCNYLVCSVYFTCFLFNHVLNTEEAIVV